MKMLTSLTRSMLCGLALMISALSSAAHGDVTPSRQDQQTAQAMSGYWYLEDKANGVWGQLILNTDGTCQLNITENRGMYHEGSRINARWRVERSVIVFESSDGVESFPFRFGNNLLSMDIISTNRRMVFARRVENSWTESLNLPEPGQKRIANRISK